MYLIGAISLTSTYFTEIKTNPYMIGFVALSQGVLGYLHFFG